MSICTQSAGMHKLVNGKVKLKRDTYEESYLIACVGIM